MSNDIQLLTNRLLAALNSNYEVIDMSSVLSVITQLEQTKITKEQLEATRLAKFINLFRKKTWSEPLARRAKNLLKKWREMHITPTSTIQQQLQQNQPHQSSLSINSESQSLSRTSHPLHVSLSQPTSPAAQTGENQRSIRHYPSQPRSLENSSLPEYPCSSNLTATKNAPSTSRKQQQLHSSLSNGGQHRTEPPIGLHQAHSTKITIPKPNKNTQIQPQSSKKQPISFANLIESQLHAPGPGRTAAGPSFIMEDNRSQSPLTLPRIPRIPRDRQSPMIIEHSVSPLDLDQNSNPSREGSLAPPSIVSGPATLAVMNNNNTISSCSRLLNGDYAATSIDLHDSNSNSNLPGNLDTIMEAQQRLLGSRSSEHRKSKKHKKEKKRHKQERLQDNGPSDLSVVGGKTAGDNQVPGLSDETQIYSGNIFPMQENLSLSNSSLSMFPNASTNVTVGNSNRGASSFTQKLESDLTFAGKFKKLSSSGTGTTGGGGGGSTGVGPHGASDITVAGDAGSAQPDVPLVDNGQETAYATVINPVKKTTKNKDGRTSVVVIESRSCSPFTPIGGNSNDTSASSSHTSNRDLIEVVNQESQGAEDVRMRALLQPKQSQPNKPIEVGLSIPEETKLPKRRGRKKGSKGADAMLAQFNTQLFEGSRLLSLASLSGNKKVKTTKELLADIQSRKLESTTSSPTLPSQSRPPSTSSEPSLHSPSTSDACSTNATMSTVARSTPDQNIVSASNFRAGVEDDSGTNSSGAVLDKKESLGFDDESKSVIKAGGIHSIEDDIQKLMSMLPHVNRDEIKWETDGEVICTCTVREVQQQKVDVVLPKDTELEELENNVKPFDQALKPIEKIEPIVPKPPSPVKVKLPQKPVKSIFDLDYDEENDPLRSFVEEAKSCKAAEAKSESNQMVDIKPPSPGVKKQQEIKPPPATSSLHLQEQRTTSTSAIISELVQPTVPPVWFPQFEIVENPNCAAKQRYEIQTNRISKFHIDTLHNRYIPNVNGNWDESEPKNIDSDGRSLAAQDEMTPDGLYERVVPEYNFLIMDRIPKDLSHIQFTKNFNKTKMLKLEKIKMKRKRSGSSSTVAEDEENKHQRKKECISSTSPIPLENCENGSSISIVAIKNELTDGFDNNMNLNNCTDSLSGSGKTIDTDKPNEDRMDCSSDDVVNDLAVIGQGKTTSGLDSMAVSGSIDSLPPPEIATNNNSNHNSNGSRRSSSCSNSSVNLRLSCSNNSSKPNNDISNNIDDAGDNSMDHEVFSYGHSNCSEDREADDDAEEDDDYDDDDDEEDEEDEEHGDFHEVVTHDMTSSTSTIGNKLVLTIKKTPSKNTPQSSPSLSLSSLAETGTSRKRKIIINDGNNSKSGEHIIDNNENDMAVAPVNVDKFSNNENLNSSQAIFENPKKILDSDQENSEHNAICAFVSSGDLDIKLETIDAAPNYCDDIKENMNVQDYVPEIKKCSSPGDRDQSDLKAMIKSSPQPMSRSSSQPDISSMALCDGNNIDEFLSDENNQFLPSFNYQTEENRTGLRNDTRTGKPQQFKEWHEVLQIRSYNDELLTVLPYVVID